MEIRINNLDQLIDFIESYETKHEDRALLIKSTIGKFTTSKDRDTTLQQLKDLREDKLVNSSIFLGDFSLDEVEATGLIKFE